MLHIGSRLTPRAAWRNPGFTAVSVWKRKFLRSGAFEQDRHRARERKGNRRHALRRNKPDFVLGKSVWFDEHIMRGRGALHDLACIGPQELIMESAANE